MFDDQISDCNSCVGVKDFGYSEMSRCCTYYPTIPNFLLGFAIDHSKSHENIEALLALNLLLPPGLVPSPKRRKRALNEYQNERWGKTERVVCDLLSKNGECSIYAFRNSVCSSWFCRKPSQKYLSECWEILRDAVFYCETAIARGAMEAAGLDLERYEVTYQGYTDRVEGLFQCEGWSQELWEELWQGLDPLDFYRQCGQFVIANSDRLRTIVDSTKIPAPSEFTQKLETSLAKQASPEGLLSFHSKLVYKSFSEVLERLLDVENQFSFTKELSDFTAEI